MVTPSFERDDSMILSTEDAMTVLKASHKMYRGAKRSAMTLIFNSAISFRLFIVGFNLLFGIN